MTAALPVWGADGELLDAAEAPRPEVDEWFPDVHPASAPPRTATATTQRIVPGRISHIRLVMVDSFPTAPATSKRPAPPGYCGSGREEIGVFPTDAAVWFPRVGGLRWIRRGDGPYGDSPRGGGARMCAALRCEPCWRGGPLLLRAAADTS